MDAKTHEARAMGGGPSMFFLDHPVWRPMARPVRIAFVEPREARTCGAERKMKRPSSAPLRSHRDAPDVARRVAWEHRGGAPETAAWHGPTGRDGKARLLPKGVQFAIMQFVPMEFRCEI